MRIFSSKIQSTLLAIFFLLIAACCEAQQYVEQAKEPKPYLFTPYNFDKVDTPIKRLVYLFVYKAEKGNISDTINIYDYDKQGRKIKEISFDDNRVSGITTFEFISPTVTQWKQRNFSNDSYDYRAAGSKYYNHSGLDSAYNNFRTVNADTTDKSNTIFSYNKDGQIITKSIYSGKHLGYKAEYVYENSGLRSYRSYTDPEYHPLWCLATEYIYKDKKLSWSKDMLVRDTGDEFLGEHYYYYDDKDRLSGEQYHYPGYSSSNKYPTKTVYKWNENELAAIDITSDTLYRKIQYRYEKGRLVEINVKTNTLRGLGREYYLAFVPYSGTLPLREHSYQEKYTYDKYNNPVAREYILDGKLVAKIVFLLEYY